MLKQRIELWTGREDFKRKVQAVQYDSARILECAVMDAALPEGATAHFFARKPSGKKVYLDCAVTGNTVSVELPDQALAETGSIPCQIEIFDKSEKRVSSFEFILEVKRTLITDTAIESTDAVTALKKYVDAAKGSADSAGKSESAAKAAQSSAEDARDKAKAAQTAAEAAQGKAETAKTGAEAAQKAAQDAQAAAEAAQKGAGESAGKAAASATQAENWTNQSKSWAVGEGYPERSNQSTDNSKFYAGQAKASADAAQALSDRLTEIAGGDIVSGNELAEALGSKMDKTATASDVGAYTKAETDDKVAAATSRHWDVSIAPADWKETDESWGGITAAFKATVDCAGMDADTDISGIALTGGNRTAAAAWQWLTPGDGSVTLHAASKPMADFSLRLTEVR